jgi:hypothetical protein
MAISDTQKVDYLYKKLGYGVAKTDTSTIKSPSNEANASPLLIRGDIVWVSSGSIPSSAPSANTAVVAVYTGAAAIKSVNDGTASTNRTWLTNQTDWIGSEFGATYQPKAWAAPAATANAALSGTRLFPDGSGNSDSWFFDPQSGSLNFADTNVPTAVTGNVVFIEGYRYIGPKGVANISANTFLQNITITNTTIGTTTANANIYISPTGTGIVSMPITTAVALPAGTTAQEPSGAPAGSFRYNTDAGTPEYYNGNSWVLMTATIGYQTFAGNGAGNTYPLTQSTSTGGVLVSLNGVQQTPGNAYSVSGNTIVFTEIPLSSDTVDVRFIAPGNPGGLVLGAAVPATSTSSGSKGQIAYNSSYVYICVESNTWIRANIQNSF